MITYKIKKRSMINRMPMHSKDIPYGTFLSILAQANVSLDQAKQFLGK